MPQITGADEIVDLDLWGNYSVPQDNPYSEEKDLQPEIWALGLRNPWRCSFDSQRPLYFVCADTGQVQRIMNYFHLLLTSIFTSLHFSYHNCLMLMVVMIVKDHYEEVDIITKGGNYGWSVYEGPFPYNPQQSPGSTPANSINPIFPVLGYNHSDVNKNEGSAAISGGYFYRSLTDPCTFGR